MLPKVSGERGDLEQRYSRPRLRLTSPFPALYPRGLLHDNRHFDYDLGDQEQLDNITHFQEDVEGKE